MTKGKYIQLILILGSMTALGPFSIDMYLPGFSGIAKDLTYYSYNGFRIIIQLFYWNFVWAIVIWTIIGSFWSKKAFIYWIAGLYFGFFRLCCCGRYPYVYRASVYTGCWELCGYSGINCDGSGFISSKGNTQCFV